jgi:hypothetical protein
VEGTALAIALRKCADFGVCSPVRLVGRPSVEVLFSGSRLGPVFAHLGYADLELVDSLGTCLAETPGTAAGLPPGCSYLPLSAIRARPTRTGFFNLAREVGEAATAENLVRSAEPLWDAMERAGGLVDSWGGGEFCHIFPRVLAFIRSVRLAADRAAAPGTDRAGASQNPQ